MYLLKQNDAVLISIVLPRSRLTKIHVTYITGCLMTFTCVKGHMNLENLSFASLNLRSELSVQRTFISNNFLILQNKVENKRNVRCLWTPATPVTLNLIPPLEL